MSIVNAVEGWAAVLRRFPANHPAHGAASFTEVWTINPDAGFTPPCALVVAIEPISDNPAGLMDFAEYDLVTQIMLSLNTRSNSDRGQELFPTYWDAIKLAALSDYSLGGTVTRQSMVGRPPTPATFQHHGTEYVGFEFALRVTVVSRGPAGLR